MSLLMSGNRGVREAVPHADIPTSDACRPRREGDTYYGMPPPVEFDNYKASYFKM